MMTIKSYMGTYDVFFNKSFSFLQELSDIRDKVVVVDEKVYNLYNTILDKYFVKKDLFIVEAVESKKTIETALKICQKATEYDAKKNLTIIAIGGGIIQDIAGFAANILYRGVQLILVPTTLLAQTDSCIGSKNSLNYLSYKNLLGTFYPPQKIHICFEFLPTLSEIDFHSGLGEIIKFNIMAGAQSFVNIEKEIDLLLQRNHNTIHKFMLSSLEFKRPFIEEDEFDSARRRLLNFAHTFGHAYEVVTEYAIPHGQAVLLGMITANKISLSRNYITEKTSQRIEDLAMRIYNVPPLELGNIDSIINIVKKDKKRQGDGIAAVLMHENFSLEVKQDITTKEARDAIINTINTIKRFLL